MSTALHINLCCQFMDNLPILGVHTQYDPSGTGQVGQYINFEKSNVTLDVKILEGLGQQTVKYFYIISVIKTITLSR